MRNYIRPIFIASALFTVITTYGQGVKFGDNKTTINAGSLLELESTNKGFLPPRISLASTTTWGLSGSGVAGMQVFNTNTTITAGNTSYPILTGGTGIYYWDGAGWVGVTPLSVVTGKFWGLTGNSGTNSSSNFLGTTDDHPLVLKVNGTLAGYIDSAASANKNTFFGLGAGTATTGGLNTFIGNSAGGSVTTGTSNVYVGGSAGNNNSSGNHNLFAGYSAGSSTSNGVQDGTFLGYAAGLNTTGNYNTFVGSQAGQGNTLGAGSVVVGYQAGYNLTAGGNSIIIGFQAGYNNTTGQNQFIGYQAGNKNTTGNTNLMEGHQAGYNNTTGFGNQFIGYQAGYTNTTGGANIFMGHQAGYNNNVSNNTFIGYLAGYNNTTGSPNHFEGLNAGYSNTTGSGNQLIGYQAGYNNTTGNFNTALGYRAGYSNVTGNRNTFIGYGTDVLTDGITNAGALGYSAKVNASNSFVIGDSSLSASTYAVNVGIGVRSPLKRLHIDAATINTASKQADSLKIDNLATATSAYNKGLLIIDSTTGYVSKQGIDVLGANNFWALKGNSSTSPGTNALGAATDANFIGTKDAQNLVIGTNSIKRMIIDQSGNAYGGGNTSAAGVNNFSWGYNNTFTNTRFSLAFGNSNAINSTSSVGSFAIGSSNQIDGISSGSGSFGVGAKIFGSTYAYSIGTSTSYFSSGTPSGYNIYNSSNSVMMGLNNKMYGGGGFANNFIFGQSNSIGTTSTPYSNCILLGGANVNAAGNGNMILTTETTGTLTGGSAGNDLTALFSGGLRFFSTNDATSTTQVVSVKSGTNMAYVGIGNTSSGTSGTAPYTGSSQHSTLQVSGSVAASTVAYSGTSYTLTDKDHTVILTGSSAATVTLPQASTCSGRMYMVVNMTSLATHKIQSYNGSATELVHGSTSLATPVASFTFNASGTTGTTANPGSRTIWQSDGSKWYLIQN